MVHRAMPFLKAVPPFRPQPFVQDKFLSIKSRTPEQWEEMRRDILSRSDALALKIRQQRESGTVPILTVPLAEEAQNINRKVQRLTAMQGFVLSDEMVYKAFHDAVQFGAYDIAVQWLQDSILAQRRGPPYPIFVLEDLTQMLQQWALPLLPNSTESTGYRTLATGREQHVRVALALRSPVMAMDSDKFPSSHRAILCSTERATQYHLERTVMPLWSAADRMGLFFSELLASTDSGGDGDPLSCLPDAAVQGAAVRGLLGAFSVQHSFLNDAPRADDATTVCTHPTLQPMQAITSFYRAMAQCAAEAQEPHLLLALHTAFCAGFLMATTTDSGIVVSLNETAWLGYCVESDVLLKEGRQILEEFAMDFISLVYYGLHEYAANDQLWHLHDLLLTQRFVHTAIGQDADNEDECVVRAAGPTWVAASLARTGSFLLPTVASIRIIKEFLHFSQAMEGRDYAPGLRRQAAAAALYVAVATSSADWLEGLKYVVSAGVMNVEGLDMLMKRMRATGFLSACDGSAPVTSGVDAVSALADIFPEGPSTPIQSLSTDMLDAWVSLLVVRVLLLERDALVAVHARTAGGCAQQPESPEVEDGEQQENHEQNAEQEEVPVPRASTYDIVTAFRDDNTRAVRHTAYMTCLGRILQAAEGTKRTCTACSPSAALRMPGVAALAVLLSQLPRSAESDTYWAALSGNACQRLSQHHVEGSLPGSSLGVLMVLLARAEQWDALQQLVQSMSSNDTGAAGKTDGETDAPAFAETSLWSSLCIDPVLFGEVFSRARDAGRASLCAQLRKVREHLFF